MTSRKIEPDVSAGCWVELYAEPGFRGDARRLFGPGDFAGVFGGTWTIQFASLVVGASAVVELYDSRRPKKPPMKLAAGERLSDLDPATHGGGVDSVRIKSF